MGPTDVPFVVDQGHGGRGEAEEPLQPGPHTGEDLGKHPHVRPRAVIEEMKQRQLPLAGHHQRQPELPEIVSLLLVMAALRERGAGIGGKGVSISLS